MQDGTLSSDRTMPLPHLLPHLLPHPLPPGTRPTTPDGVHREAAAELAATLLLTLARGLDHVALRQPGHVALRRAADERRPGTGTTLVGKRVLVVGYGALGAAVAARLGAFRCEVVLVARTGRTTPSGRVHGAAELPGLLPTAEAVVLCAPLTEGTRALFGAAELALLKDGALLVDVAGDELLDTGAVIREVRAGRLRVATSCGVISLAEGNAPILQYTRCAAQVRPPRHTTSTVEGNTR